MRCRFVAVAQAHTYFYAIIVQGLWTGQDILQIVFVCQTLFSDVTELILIFRQGNNWVIRDSQSSHFLSETFRKDVIQQTH
jgi:hypothetical protein